MTESDITLEQIVAELESLGTAQNQKIYRRHGVVDEMFGVSYANQEKLAKKLKKANRSDLAIPLWETANHDARVLATKILSPEMINLSVANQLVRGVTHSLTATGLADAVAKVNRAPQIAGKWVAASASRSHWKVFTGWALIASIALNKKPVIEIPDDWFDPFVKRIVAEIHSAPNDIRYQMNSALIAIGSKNEALREPAIAAAKKIGKVSVDHGETSCKTPDAEEYIGKVWARKK